MKHQARLIVRDGGPEDGMIIGTRLKGQTLFKPGHVYGVDEILDTVIIKDLGLSAIKNSFVDAAIGGCWGNDVSYLLDCAGKCLFLTEKEYEEYKMRNGTCTN